MYICIYMYIYVYVCMYIYVYIYTGKDCNFYTGVFPPLTIAASLGKQQI